MWIVFFISIFVMAVIEDSYIQGEGQLVQTQWSGRDGVYQQRLQWALQKQAALSIFIV